MANRTDEEEEEDHLKVANDNSAKINLLQTSQQEILPQLWLLAEKQPLHDDGALKNIIHMIQRSQ